MSEQISTYTPSRILIAIRVGRKAEHTTTPYRASAKFAHAQFGYLLVTEQSYFY